LSREIVVFVFGGDLWSVSREGGNAVRLTTHPGEERHPKFSPDGRQIAFSATYDGNVDVYVMPAEGGVPVRLTAHPSDDLVRGWTPDGRHVLFASLRHSANDSARLFTVPIEGGPTTEIPLPAAEDGSYSPDGARLAYVPTLQWQAAWKRYRGGQTRPIWIAQLADSSVEKVPRENSQDFNPMWVGNEIYFLSDRNGPVTLFAFDTQSRQVRQALPNSGFDFKSASVGPDGIIYEQFGKLGLFNPATGQSRFLNIRTVGDFAEVRPRFGKWEDRIPTVGRLSPSGQRAVFEARGEIFTVPADKGDVRNLTRTPGIAERDPAWSPDGQSIAYFSEDTGEYALHIRAQDGTGVAKRIQLGSPPSFYYAPKWSPDGSHLAYLDKRGKFWSLTVTNAQPLPVEIDSNYFGSGHMWGFGDDTAMAWSPDSRWIAYVRTLPNNLRAIFVYSLEEGRSRQLTDGMAEAGLPVFADSGKYLYFAVSTDAGPTLSGLDLSAMNRPVTRSLYLAVLDRTLPSPLASESDEEKAPTSPSKPAEKSAVESASNTPSATNAAPAAGTASTNALVVRIDFEGISQRILALPLPPKNYTALTAGKSNVLFAAEAPVISPIDENGPPSLTVQRFDLGKRKADTFLEGVHSFQVSGNLEKVLYRRESSPRDRAWFIAGAETSPKAGEGQLKFGNSPLWIDPRQEWRQMYEEAWRIQRDFFYDPGLHGLDLAKFKARYAPYVEGLVSRADLNYLFEEMLGELSVGHMFVGGGDSPRPPKVSVGLLGADFRVENGRYRIARVYDGENWNPRLRAPLTEPGVNATTGEYILSVDGIEVLGTMDLDVQFQNKAGRIVTLRLGTNPDGSGAREVRVTPIDDEQGLRHRAWVEDNRRTVARLSQGRLGYVHLPDTANGGYASFTRYYFAQQDKQGFVIDERYNHGGLLADYVVDHLSRSIVSWAIARDGKEISFPFGAHPGPKVLLINEFAGSGGDALPWLFRKAKIGPLIGKRTWGGLVGIGGYPDLLDGGMVMAPHIALYGTSGSWEVENVGIAPDIEIELDPKAWREGRDTQLEKAVEVALERLQQTPIQRHSHPKYPIYHPEQR
jgi:tricorn protease